MSDGTSRTAPAQPSRVSFDDHPCLSALDACSGLVPCEPCRVALATWVVPKALLAAECGTAEQVGRYLDTFAEAQRALVVHVRQAAVEHEAKIAATREAIRNVPSTPPPAPASAKAEIASQVAPLKKKRSGAAKAMAEASLNELFAESVTASTSTPTEEKTP